MAQQTIGIGTVADDGTGDPARTAFDKVNDNFDELYAANTVKWFVPASVTKVAGGTATGTVAGVQTMLDGTEYHVVEANGTLGWDLIFTFSGITVLPTELVIRAHYEGNHDWVVQVWDYSVSPNIYKELMHFETADGFKLRPYILPDWTRFVSGGAAKVRLLHSQNGNPSDDLHIDFIGFRSLGRVA